jgi:hypothetical protein
LNNNVQDLQNKNNTLQQSVESANSRNAATQKSLDYYQNYFKHQQTAVAQASDDVKSALTQAGVSNGDVQQVNSSVHVRLDEDELFKNNSATVSAGGKKALDGLAGVIRNHSNMNVFVGGGDSTSGDMTTMGTGNGNASTASTEPHKPRHHRRSTASRSSSGTGSSASGGGSSGSSNATAGSSTAGSPTSGATPHKKVHHHYSSEGGTAIYNNPRLHNRALALKQARMVAVADNFLQNGVEKVNVSLRQSSMNATPGKSIHVVLTPKMEDFSPRQ